MLNVRAAPKSKIPVFTGKLPDPEEISVLTKPLLECVIMLGAGLDSVKAKWALGGDAAELISGVILEADHLEILTTREGCEEICNTMSEYLTLGPAGAEKRLERDADVDGKMYPVFVKSHYAELTINGVRVEIYGDEQLKVGDWEWGDPLDFEPVYSYIVGTKVPLVPLRLKSELDLGLGWLDRVEKISDAVKRSHHRF
jgi:hypothetical protein